MPIQAVVLDKMLPLHVILITLYRVVIDKEMASLHEGVGSEFARLVSGEKIHIVVDTTPLFSFAAPSTLSMIKDNAPNRGVTLIIGRNFSLLGQAHQLQKRSPTDHVFVLPTARVEEGVLALPKIVNGSEEDFTSLVIKYGMVAF
jgi:hypothetical protein